MCPESMLVVSRNFDTALLQLVSLACGVTELPSKLRILVLLKCLKYDLVTGLYRLSLALRN